MTRPLQRAGQHVLGGVGSGRLQNHHYQRVNRRTSHDYQTTELRLRRPTVGAEAETVFAELPAPCRPNKKPRLESPQGPENANLDISIAPEHTQG
ncbi:hypothetical protein FCN18_34625 [Prauserella endophytica]|uniref:Uncharacterized protein n=2 Tax=Prauserella endophytica TaxID=1592324 RepID=A0ABY2RV14_9PSEU|nr:hypothetical protein FCN18_34625 [Prauserella endophytica]